MPIGGILSLESDIKELERKLSLKNAYIAASIKLPTKIANDVKKEVTDKLRELCLALANEQDVSVTDLSLSKEEIVILKMLASKVLYTKSSNERVSEPASVKKNGKISKGKLEKIKATSATSKTGIIMMLDNIEPSIRKKIKPESQVLILNRTKAFGIDLAYVEDKQGLRFNVPIDDIDFQ